MSLNDIVVYSKPKIKHFKHFKTIWTYGRGGENTMICINNINVHIFTSKLNIAKLESPLKKHQIQNNNKLCKN
jgi:hypothetical protein